MPDAAVSHADSVQEEENVITGVKIRHAGQDAVHVDGADGDIREAEALAVYADGLGAVEEMCRVLCLFAAFKDCQA